MKDEPNTSLPVSHLSAGHLWFLGQQREMMARQISNLHESCGAASKALAEFAFGIYQREHISLARLAREAGVDPVTFRAIMCKHIGRAKIKSAWRERKGKTNGNESA